jgi:CheY-like chemotaxis protein
VLNRVVNSDGVMGADLITRHGILEEQAVLDILLVEDHVVNQKLAMALLGRWGHRVTVAENGKLALDALAQQHFDMVFMDMMMPVMDGLEATRRIRASEHGTRVPIVAMTANAMKDDRDRCLAAGMDDYVSKPVELAQLQRVLARFAPSVAAVVCVQSDVPTSEFDYAGALARSDQDVLEIITDVFIEQWPKDLAKMTQALTSEDWSPLVYTVHALKGTLGMFGAKPAVILAAELEEMTGNVSANLTPEANADIAQRLRSLVCQVELLVSVLRAGTA